MEKLLEHVNIATKMYDKKLNLELIKEFTIDQLEKLCSALNGSGLESNIYFEYFNIQRALAKSPEAITYLSQIYKSSINLQFLNDFIEIINNNNEFLTDYKVQEIIAVMKEDTNNIVRYTYLKYFYNIISTEEQKNIVIKNLEYFYSSENISLKDLNNQERLLFLFPFLSDYNLIPREHIVDIIKILANNQYFQNLMCFLYKNKLNIPLSFEEYESININAKEIHSYIVDLSKKINNESLYMLLLKWVKNDCNLYDLKILKHRLANFQNKDIEKIISTRAEYINFIFGTRLKNVNLKELPDLKENLIIYAISNNKKNFLGLIENNYDLFLEIPSTSILFKKELYSIFLNINDLTLNNLNEFRYMCCAYSHISNLTKTCYTFDEIKTLFKSTSKKYYQFYNHLLSLKIDERLIRIRQLIKKDLLNFVQTENDLEKLAEKIKIKPLYNWMNNDFKSIKGLTPTDAVDLLINYNELLPIVSEIKNKDELSFALRNKNSLSEYKTLKDFRSNILNVDNCWKKLVEEMQISQSFIENNIYHIKAALLRNESELMYDYYRLCNSSNNKDSFKLIVKSELMGEFQKLKYHDNDLNKELSFNLQDYQITEWTQHNREQKEGDIVIKEYDDFLHTMILGEKPVSTCLSYKGGMYNKCLLACFDSNKKILYAKLNDKIVARAMIRLTKGSYKDMNNEHSLSFVDLEKIDEHSTGNKQVDNEILTLFLERTYLAGVSESIGNKIKKLFIKLLEEKAYKMNALPVLSNYYNNVIDNNYIATRYYMYISKSKAGYQYLDSLSGQVMISDEGQYKLNTFLVFKENLNKTK